MSADSLLTEAAKELLRSGPGLPDEAAVKTLRGRFGLSQGRATSLLGRARAALDDELVRWLSGRRRRRFKTLPGETDPLFDNVVRVREEGPSGLP